MQKETCAMIRLKGGPMTLYHIKHQAFLPTDEGFAICYEMSETLPNAVILELKASIPKRLGIDAELILFQSSFGEGTRLAFTVRC
jgi:hypothetical protein